MVSNHSQWLPAFAAIMLLIQAGCAQHALVSENAVFRGKGPEPQSEFDIEHGERRPIVDSIGWVVGIPSKIVLLDSRADNHDVGVHTEQQLVDYMSVNGLHDTKVRVNQYDPIGEWKRLRMNQDVGAGWRYTLGTLHTLGYTLSPGRIFGGDSYNPYTNSIHVYSDIPALALEQAAYAKDVASRTHPGTYAAVQELPLVGLWHESLSKRDVLNYYAFHGTPNQNREARRVLHPQFGAEVGDELDEMLIVGDGIPVFRLTGAAIGHVAARRDEAVASEPPPREQFAPMSEHAPPSEPNRLDPSAPVMPRR